MDPYLFRTILMGFLYALGIGIIVYYVGRFVLRLMKGKLELELHETIAVPNHPFHGSVMLHAKRPIRGLLMVSMVGRERRSSGNADSSGSDWHEVYRKDHTLEDMRDYNPGFRQVYDFELNPPTDSEIHAKTNLLRGMADLIGGVK